MLAIAILALLPDAQWRSLIQYSAETFTDYEVEIEGNVDVNLFTSTPSVQLERFTVMMSGDHKMIANIESFSAEIVLSSLFSDPLVVKNIGLKNSEIFANPMIEASKAAANKAPASQQVPDDLKSTAIPYIEQAALQNVKIFRSQQSTTPEIAIEKLTLTSEEQKASQKLNGTISLGALTYNLSAELPPFKSYSDLKGLFDLRLHAESKSSPHHRLSLITETAKIEGNKQQEFLLKTSGPGLEPFLALMDTELPRETAYDVSVTGQLKLASKTIVIDSATLDVKPFFIAVEGSYSYGADPKADLDIHVRDLNLNFFDRAVADAGPDLAATEDEGPQQLFSDEPLYPIPMATIPKGSYSVIVSFDKAVASAEIQKENTNVIQAENIAIIDPATNQSMLEGTSTIRVEGNHYDLSGKFAITEFDLSNLSPLIKEQTENLAPIEVFGTKPVLEGQLFTTLEFATNGNTTAELAATLKGTARFAVERGMIQAVIVEGLHLDILESAASLFAANVETNIQCAYSKLDIDEGLIRFNNTVLATADSNVRLDGLVNLQNESLWVKITSRVKDYSLTTIDPPLIVSGPLLSPAIGLWKNGNGEQKHQTASDWIATVGSSIVDNVTDFFTGLEDENEYVQERESVCVLYADQIDTVKAQSLAH